MLVLLLRICSSFGQTADTLSEIKVSAIRYTDISTSVVPVQQLTKDNLGRLNSLSVADAVKYFSGVQVKDYGGIGGLKTVSVRSLGASNTAVSYDGILLSDVQGGQIDLGKLSLDNIENISLYNSQPTNLLLPARSFAAASILELRSSIPAFDPQKKWHLKTVGKAGSFGYVAPALNVQYQPGKKFFTGASAEWQRADGHYPYKTYDTGHAIVKRQNSAINSIRAEYDAGLRFSDSNLIKLKAYYYFSKRGLPGGIVQGNTSNHQQLNDENFFVQASWNKKFDNKNSLLFSSKYAYNYNKYVDPDYFNTQHYLKNVFHQNEYYFSGVFEHDFCKTISAALASDYSSNTLNRTDTFVTSFPDPTRNAWLNNISAKASFEKISLQGNLLHTTLRDKVERGAKGKNIHAFSPALAASYQLATVWPVQFRAFYKKIFRAPTFNDLYYTNIGNTNLRPEYNEQYNAGVTLKTTGTHLLQSTVFTADAYYNKVKDKILAVPRAQNLFQWSMENIGKVEIKGLDVAMQFYLKKTGAVNISGRLAYTYQQALDVSDKSLPTYNKQIPYTPEHSGSINVNALWNRFAVSYNVLLSGYRYRTGEQLPINLVEEWATQDVVISYQMRTISNHRCKAMIELNNIFNKQYEMIRYYPMPRFNYRATVIAEL